MIKNHTDPCKHIKLVNHSLKYYDIIHIQKPWKRWEIRITFLKKGKTCSQELNTRDEEFAPCGKASGSHRAVEEK